MGGEAEPGSALVVVEGQQVAVAAAPGGCAASISVSLPYDRCSEVMMAEGGPLAETDRAIAATHDRRAGFAVVPGKLDGGAGDGARCLLTCNLHAQRAVLEFVLDDSQPGRLTCRVGDRNLLDLDLVEAQVATPGALSGPVDAGWRRSRDERTTPDGSSARQSDRHPPGPGVLRWLLPPLINQVPKHFRRRRRWGSDPRAEYA